MIWTETRKLPAICGTDLKLLAAIGADLRQTFSGQERIVLPGNPVILNALLTTLFLPKYMLMRYNIKIRK